MIRTINKLNVLLVVALLGGCMAAPGEEVTPAQQQALAEDTSEALQVVGEIAYEISGLAEDPPMESDDGMPAPAPAGEASPDGPAERCATIRWIPLGVTFDECVLPDGRVLDGGIRLTLDYDGVRGAIGVRADALSVGDATLDGFFVVSSDGTDLQLDADVRYVDADTDVQVVLAAARVTHDAAGLHLNGSGSITSDGLTWAVVATDVTWGDPLACHATDGSADLTIPEYPPMTILFTPDEVTVQIGTLPPVDITPSC